MRVLAEWISKITPKSEPTLSEEVVKAMQFGFVRCATKHQCSRNSDSLECEHEAELIQILTFSAFQSPERAGAFRISFSIPNLDWKSRSPHRLQSMMRSHSKQPNSFHYAISPSGFGCLKASCFSGFQGRGTSSVITRRELRE